MLIKGGSSVSDRLLALLNTDAYDGYPPKVRAKAKAKAARERVSSFDGARGEARLSSPGSLFDNYARILRPRPSATDAGRRRPNQAAARERPTPTRVTRSHTAAPVSMFVRVYSPCVDCVVCV
ncbi:Uncharacterized protein DBV15_05976 [Temnothorax longispinosus]|uniref:Uncharacterized protein n=1 Tax=Temnothorax longispinosus TaxID=300112 RepID=A0A4S2KHQ8_9HYME|nr:Uncharacterized protein DBV15_05976 [Temnothorax longispinosus]